MTTWLRQALPIPSVLAGILLLSFLVNRSSVPDPTPPAVLDGPKPPQVVAAPAASPAPVEPGPEVAETEPEPDSEPEPVAEAPPAPVLDREAVARAEADLDAASRDRARAEARAAEAKRELEASANRAALEASRARRLSFRVRDPSAQIARASARGGFLKAERDKLTAEVAQLRSLPLPKATSILSKNPVSQPAKADEFHFELRHDRVAFIDLDRLLELAKSDAQVKLRMADRTGVLTSQVGPVGWFSLSYVLGRAQSSIEELLERHSIRFDLRGWEVVPRTESRGEAYESTRNPISEYARAINRLTPGRSVVTMWVYPDSFNLYRRLRDELNERGFSVAARPLPEGMMIRGSPMGSVSATQ
ncbi:hypothetical protein [Planctomyces sp. SH-PL62]|uniref:hypothetical protein n=1 Tax=Planctomyces sp. SH-PL62 TaxID=1636152 RepID=UPI00078EBFE3|nr:hypothetical protein [Planctomyces sp. SH-PL62]AMV38737.1 hypothetical protein VT85_14960 [Planctomyces sp. SH-PL62]